MPFLGTKSKRSQIVRKLLFLPPDAPNRSVFELREGKLARRSPDELEEATNRWHAEGWRGSVSDWVVKNTSSYALQKHRETINDTFSRFRIKTRLGQKRHLHIRSPYICYPDDTWIDVRVELGDDLVYLISIVKHDYFTIALDARDFLKESLFERDVCGYMLLDELIPVGDTVVVRNDTFNDEVVRSAVEYWYKTRYSGKRGHWSNVENQIPDIDVHLHWSDRAQDEADIDFYLKQYADDDSDTEKELDDDEQKRGESA